MKEIDEMVSKLKRICWRRFTNKLFQEGNAKSGMDCIRLTGKNPYVEQEEQKKNESEEIMKKFLLMILTTNFYSI